MKSPTRFAPALTPLVILKDMLEIAADIATVQAAGNNYQLPGPADWTRRTHEIAATLTPAQAQRNWQILLSGYRDTQTAPEADTACAWWSCAWFRRRVCQARKKPPAC